MVAAPVPPEAEEPQEAEEEESASSPALKRLNRELYTREESSELRQRREGLKQLGITQKSLGRTSRATADVSSTRFKDLAAIREQRRRKVWIGVGIGALLLALFVAAVGGTIWYRLRQNVTPEDARIAVVAPTEFTAGEEITYQVEYANESHVDWQNVEVSLEQPAGFSLTGSDPEMRVSGRTLVATVGDLPAGDTGVVTVRGRLIGELNVAAVAQAEIAFTPENFPSGRFTQVALLSTTITAVPVEVSVEANDEAGSGERMLVTFHVRNTSAQPVAQSYLALVAPVGMQLALEDEAFSPGFSVIDSRWGLPEIAPLESVTRQAVVYVDGNPGERRTLDVEVGVTTGEETFVQRSVSHVVTLAASELSIEQAYNGEAGPLTVTAGTPVTGVVTYANTGTVGLQEVVVQVTFEGDGLNQASLRLPRGGAYDPRTQTITWTSASIPELGLLQPQQTGQLEYEFTIVPTDQLPVAEDGPQHKALVAMAKIDSPDLRAPVGQEKQVVSDRFMMPIASNLQLGVDSFYDDGRLGLESTGPLPPQVGEETTYTLRFRVGSTLNDVGEVELRAVVPEGVRPTGERYITRGEMEFNERTGELIWRIPLLSALTGRTKPAEDLHVQVAIVPGAHQVGRAITFLREVTLKGTDQFVDTPLEVTASSLPTTDTASRGQGAVQP